MALTASAICIAIAFSFNNIFGFNLREETYSFDTSGFFKTRSIKGNKMVIEEWPTFVLPGNKFAEYPQIRFCVNPTQVNDSTVTFVIGTGMFGIDYLSDKQIGPDTLALPF